MKNALLKAFNAESRRNEGVKWAEQMSDMNRCDDIFCYLENANPHDNFVKGVQDYLDHQRNQCE